MTDPLSLPLDVLRSRTGDKWGRYGPDVIPAGLADMDVATAPPARRAIEDLLDRNDLGYAADGLPDQVADAFARRMSERFGWFADPTGVRVLTDLVQGLSLCIELFSEPGDGVVVQTPCYPPILSEIEALGRRTVAHELRSESEWRLDADELAGLVDPNTPLLMLVNPHNPTGRCFTREELEAVGEVAIERDLIVVSDEIHQDLVWDGRIHVPFASLSAEIASRTVTLNSAAKSFNLAGLRCGLAHFGSPALADCFDTFPATQRGGPSVVGMAATLAVWSDDSSWQTDVLAALHSRRDQVTVFLADHLPDVGYLPPEATYLAWLDFRALGLGDDPGTFFEERALVALRDGPEFGHPGLGRARLNFATSEAVLAEILERMVTALDLRSRGDDRPTGSNG